MLLCTAKFRNITPFSNHLSACKFLNTAENFRFDLSRERKGLKDFPIHWIKNSTLILGVSLFHLCFVLFFFFALVIITMIVLVFPIVTVFNFIIIMRLCSNLKVLLLLI